MDDYEAISRVASEWWGEVVKNPKMDNSDNIYTGLFTKNLMDSMVEQVDDNSEFVNHLSDLIYEELNKVDGRDIIISVDYHPCKILSKACELSGVSEHNLPIKTTMLISKDCVRVSYGYGSKYENLFVTRKFCEEEIYSLKESLGRYQSGYYDEYIINQSKKNEIISSINNRISKYELELKEM